MRIMSVIPTLGTGGAEALSTQLAIGFAKRGLQSTLHVVAEIRGERGKKLENDLTLAQIPVACPNIKSPKEIIPAIISLRKSILANKPDVILTHLPSAELISIAASGISGSSRPTLTRVIHLPKLSLTQEFSDHLFSGTIAVSNDILKLLNTKKIQNAKYIPNGVPLTADVELPMPALQPIKLAMVGHFRGGLKGQKGLDIAVQCIPELLKQIQDLELHVFGCTKTDSQILKQLTDEIGVTKHVHNHGIVASVSESLKALNPHICLIPSRIEGESIALMEYSILGIPVVLSNIPSFNRQIHPDFDWSIFENDNHADLAKVIIKRINKGEFRNAKYREFSSSQFSIDRTIESYIEFLHNTLESDKNS